MRDSEENRVVNASRSLGSEYCARLFYNRHSWALLAHNHAADRQMISSLRDATLFAPPNLAVVPLKASDPDIPVTNRPGMVLQQKRLFRRMRLILCNGFNRGCSEQLHMIMRKQIIEK